MSLYNLLVRTSRKFFGESTIPTGRELQLRLDTALLYTLCHHHRPRRGPPDPPCPSQSEIASLVGVDSLPEFERQAQIVRSYLHVYVSRNLNALFKATRTAYGSDAGRGSVGVSELLREQLGFSVEVRASEIQDEAAGRGVFVRGRLPAGRLLTLYPGVSYMPSQFKFLPGFPDKETITDYFISRYDGVMIDGSADVQISLDTRADAAEEEDKSTHATNREGDAEFVHPLALGHIVNHPPKSSPPNVLQFMLDLDINSLPPGVRDLVPNVNWGFSEDRRLGRSLAAAEDISFRQRVPSCSAFVSKMNDPERVRRTMALIALRDIEDEEVYMNYRFNPSMPDLPAWYHDCDSEVSDRRWQVKGPIM